LDARAGTSPADLRDMNPVRQFFSMLAIIGVKKFVIKLYRGANPKV
jgi:hypothetical protein